jgi:flagellar protein FlgJ
MILTPPDTSALPPDEVAKAWKTAQDFEAMALGALLQPMFDTAHAGQGAFGGGNGEEQFRPMLVTEIARSIAAHGGVGIAAPVFAQIIRMQEQTSS